MGGLTRPLGIVMLDTRFPRVVGDIGNPETFAYPVRYRMVRGASPARVIDDRGAGLLGPFIDAARALAAEGCAAITTSCGFLALFQREMAAAVDVPVATSSLLQIARINAALPSGRQAGVITISAPALTRDHFLSAGADPATPVAGVAANGEFARAILGDQPEFDAARLRAEVLGAGLCLVREHCNLGALVLECTNMPPYSAALAAATGLPVYDVVTLADCLMGQSAR